MFPFVLLMMIMMAHYDLILFYVILKIERRLYKISFNGSTLRCCCCC
eukprot:UN09356